MTVKTLINDKKGVDHREELQNFLTRGDVKWKITWAAQNDDPMDENNDIRFSLIITEPKIGLIEMDGTEFSYNMPTAKVDKEYKNMVKLENIRKAKIWEDHVCDAGKTSLTKDDIVNGLNVGQNSLDKQDVEDIVEEKLGLKSLFKRLF